MRVGRGLLGLAAVVAAALAAAAAAAFLPGPGAGEVPTVVVERRPFALVVPAEGTLRAVRATPVTVPMDAPQPARLAWIAPDGARVAAGDVVVRFDPSELEKEREDAAAGLAATRLKQEGHTAESAAALRNLERDAAAARLEEELSRRFRSRDPDLHSRKEILDSRLEGDLAVRRREHAEEARRSQETLARTQEELLELEESRARRALEEAERGLASLALQAPHAGILVLERDRRGELPRVGDSIWPGQRLAEIPDLAELEAEVYVLEADAGALAPGRPARLVVEGRPGRVYGAEIRRVDSLARPRFRGSPVQYFAVVLALEETDPERMRPGRRVRARLLLEELEAALVVPRQALFDRDGRKVVYRLREGGFEAVEVDLGAGDPGRVVVADGLAPGDVVALADPEAPKRGAAAGAGEGEDAGREGRPGAAEGRGAPAPPRGGERR